MRPFIIWSALLVTAVAFGVGFARAQSAPWCANLDDGTTQCAYYTEQECLETVSGVGGQCTQNPSGAPPQSVPSTSLQRPSGWAPIQVGPPPGLDGVPPLLRARRDREQKRPRKDRLLVQFGWCTIVFMSAERISDCK
jgi:hypothetical protein